MKMNGIRLAVVLLLAASVCLSVAGCAGKQQSEGDGGRDMRIAKLIDFFSRTVYAGQCAQALEAEVRPDPGLYDPQGHPADELKAMVALADSMAALGTDEIAGWVDQGTADQGIAHLLAAGSAAPAPLAAGLPYNVLRSYLEQRFGKGDENSILATCNTFQLMTEIERDADLVQELMNIYLRLGLKQCLSSFGANGDNLDSLLAVAEKLAPATGRTPYEMEVADWQLLLHKLEMWEAKNSGRRDRTVLAAEMIASDPEVISLLDKLRALPPKRVAFLGHSLTMSLHWSTYASWCDLAAEIVKAVNPGFSYMDINSGGLSPNEVSKRGHLDQIREYKPQETYILMSPREMMTQVASVDTLIGVLQSVGSKVYIVDGVRPWNFQRPGSLEQYHEWLSAYCADKGLEPLLFQNLWKTEHADTSGWRPLKNDIHMNTPGHVFYARKLLEFWAGQVGG